MLGWGEGVGCWGGRNGLIVVGWVGGSVSVISNFVKDLGCFLMVIGWFGLGVGVL